MLAVPAPTGAHAGPVGVTAALWMSRLDAGALRGLECSGVDKDWTILASGSHRLD